MRKYDYGLQDEQSLWQQQLESRLAALERAVKLTSVGGISVQERDQTTTSVSFLVADQDTFKELIDVSVDVPESWNTYECRITWSGVLYAFANAENFAVRGVTPDGNMNTLDILTSAVHGHPGFFGGDHTPVIEAKYATELYIDVMQDLESTGTQEFKMEGSWEGWPIENLYVVRQNLLVELTRTS